ncbi:UTRA domain-containing protein [Porticoccaceae bacterium]|nr:UTRA domain-containing protein [Porticoccaceae bacterium]
MSQNREKFPRYAQIKSHIKAQLDSGLWRIGERIPSETQLSDDFSVSRMTARRAVQELADEGLLERSVGAGTFVAQPPSPISAVELPDFQQHFSFSNPQYSNRIIALEAIAAERDIAALLGFTEGELIYYSVVVHSIDSVPIQWEECFVSPQLVPAYLKQNYHKVSPQAYMNWVIIPSRTEHQLQAITADPVVTGALGLATLTPCMKISRRSWNHEQVISVSRCIASGVNCRIGAELLL